MEYTLRFATKDRMKRAMNALDRNPKFRLTCYGRDWGEHNFACPWSPMFYVTFENAEKG